MLPILDFSTIKNDLFPVVAAVFSKTSSMTIKIRGLEAFNVLCGGSVALGTSSKDLMGASTKSSSGSAVLDKYTVQEKVVPLLKGIKTKEPTVMVGINCALYYFSLTSVIDGRARSFQAGRKGC